MSTFDPEEGDLLGYYSQCHYVNRFCILADVEHESDLYGNWSTFPECLLFVKSSTWAHIEGLHTVVPKNYL